MFELVQFCSILLLSTLTWNWNVAAWSRSGSLSETWKNEDIDYLHCGKGVNLAESNYKVFGLNSSDKLCSLTFVGSKNYECVPGIYCDGYAGWANLGDVGSTTEKYIIIEDGFEGRIEGYGNFHFDGIGRLPRAGYEIFLTFQGVIPSHMKCVAFCKEDVKPEVHGFTTTILSVDNATNYVYKKQNNCKCGIKNDVQNPYGSQPWLVAIGDPKQGPRLSFCTGALITNLHVVTSASCLHDLKEDQSYYVLVHANKLDREPGTFSETGISGVEGWNDPELSDEDENTYRVEFKKSNTFIHPLYEKDLATFDIGIISLPMAVVFKVDQTWPICLGKPGEVLASNVFLFGGESTLTYIGGWGYAWPPINGESRPRVRSVRIKGGPMIIYRNEPDQKHEECKIDESPKDTGFCMNWRCFADIGSPIGMGKWKENGIASLYGILSGHACDSGEEIPKFHDTLLTRSWVYYVTRMAHPEWCIRETAEGHF